eukprot:COSAG02_NODE_9911_length_2076_cov_24.310066_3_plen_80_part_00
MREIDRSPSPGQLQPESGLGGGLGYSQSSKVREGLLTNAVRQSEEMDLFFLGPTTQTIDLKGLCVPVYYSGYIIPTASP